MDIVLTSLTANCVSLLAYGDRMVHDRFDGDAGFAIDLGIKDSV